MVKQKGIVLSLSKGFTLLELLIVIGLIGILVSIAAVSYSSVQKKSRDARRMQDMRSVQDAFEQYNADNASAYPTDTTGTWVTTYLPAGFPVDPKNSDPYQYTVSSTTVDGYCICATLEGTKGNSDIACEYSAPDADKNYFCVKNLQ